jgi:repressor LexA
MMSTDDPEVSLTPMRRAILDFIRDHLAEHGYLPSIREIGDEVGLTSTSTVSHHLKRLERVGLIRRAAYKSRASAPVDAKAVA